MISRVVSTTAKAACMSDEVQSRKDSSPQVVMYPGSEVAFHRTKGDPLVSNTIIKKLIGRIQKVNSK
jgi:hypothetical protein